ncbi:MAG: hypothetical protein Q8L53_06415 [Aestuariivirga sp.]|nr:hypothetical protein [Aestuariivirga sp.]
MSQLCIEDPLGAVTVCAALAAEIEQIGFAVETGNDAAKLNSTKLETCRKPVSPFFDPEVCNFTPERFFWMKLTSATGAVSGLQAYRYDYVDSNLADWGPNLTIGLAMRRQELMVPTHAAPPKNSIAERIRGKLVFHGEFWVDPQVRNRKLMEKFSRLGMILSLIKWNPDSVWALSSERMASHGHPNRMGYTYMEKGFLRWQWATDGIDLIEWLNIAERHAIEQMINEMKTSTN